MAVIQNQNQNREKKDYYQDCFVPGTLTAVRPKTVFNEKPVKTLFRPLPEFDSQGNLLPMVKSLTAAGPDFSNIVTEEVVINTGVSTKFSGLCRASDSDAQDAINMVFPSLYIKLKSRQKRGEIPANMVEKVRGLLEEKEIPGGKSKIKHKLLERSSSIGFMQGIALMVNDKPLERPAVKQAMVMSANLCAIMSKVLEEAFKNKIDVFSPQSGNVLVISGMGPDSTVGRTVNVYTVTIDKVTPIAPAKAKELWVPWDTAFKRITVDQQIMKAIGCFGRDVVELVYPDDVARIMATQGVQTKPQTTVVQQAAPAAPAAPTTPAAPPASASVELDLSNAISGEIGGDEPDEGDDGGAAAAAPAGKPASAEALASGYNDMLNKL